jgi:16S rRNA (cytosine1402-N4)-methyltransferase
MRFLRADFDAALAELAAEGVEPDVVLFDFGVSSMQVDAWERGFSYSFDAPLDMRMDPDAEPSARTVVNEWPESRIAEALRNYADERHARSIARRIVERRPLETTAELVEAVRAGLPPAARFGRGNPAKRTFQAIRIAVNRELEAIDAALPEAWEMLAPGGRLAAISFHSLEDRRVKRFLADRARGCICPPELPVCRCGLEPEAKLLTRGGLAPSAGEVAENPRSSSARLRVARKLEGAGA